MFKEYAKHVKTIRDSLPEDACVLSSISFHDATIKKVKHVSKKEVEVVIEGGEHDILSESSFEYGGYTLTFSDIKKSLSSLYNRWRHMAL
jgi:hypothetical protein